MTNLTDVEKSFQDDGVIWSDLASICLVKIKSGNNRICEICSKLTIRKPNQRHRLRSADFIVSFKQISHMVLLLSLLILNK